jgi:hypothetical protein
MKYIYIILFFVVILLVRSSKLENFKIIDLKKTGYHRCDEYPIGEITTEVSNMRGLKKNNDDWFMYYPCGYTDAEDEIKTIKIIDNNQKIFMIDGCDYIVSKFTLWDILERTYGKYEASKLLPKSYLSYDKEDVKKFWIFYNEKIKNNINAKFIIKNDQQRQEGIHLLRDKKDIEELIKKEEYVMQEYLQNPFTIIGHKINLRYYLLIVCKPNKREAYIHSNGFVYYTAEKYDKDSLEFHKNITSGYVDRKIYENNPLTVEQFHNHLIDNNYNFSKYLKNLIVCLRKILYAIDPYICKQENLKNNIKFQLFGCDVAPNKNLDVQIMELNKGPDFTPKDDRDRRVKLKVLHDILDLVDDTNNIDLEEENDFIKIWET